MKEMNKMNEMFKDLDKLLRIPSVKGEPCENAPFGLEPRRALDCYLDLARSFGLACGDINGYCGYVEYGDTELPSIGILCHLDVVPAGDGWDFQPYALTESDGYLYGRGVVDDKGPAIAVLYALKSIKDEGIKLKRRVRIIVGCDEESGSGCMHYYAKNCEIPEMSITPDADFPLINSEKGILRVKATIKKDKALLEHKVNVFAGNTINVVPAHASLDVLSSSIVAAKLLGWADSNPSFTPRYEDTRLVLGISGVAGHAMAPHKADNALWKAFNALKAVNGYLGSAVIDNIADNFCHGDSAKVLGIADFDEESGDLTISLDICEDTGKALELSFDIRYPRTSSEAGIISAIKGKLPTGSKLEKLGGEPPLYIPTDSKMVQTLLGVYRECTGDEAGAKYCGGGTYARRLPNTIAFGPTFAGSQTNIHNKNECISVGEFNKLPIIYKKAMEALSNL